jgi:dTDP-4-amino-4,6-dideoxygalactose transaminase
MDSIQAEVLVNKLPLLDTHNKRRREIASMYDEALRDVVRVPVQNQHSLHVYHQYVIQSEHTKRIKDVLASKNIQSRTYYPTPINELEPYRTNETFPNSQRAGMQGLAIPVHQYLTDQEVTFIIDTIKEAL